MPWISILYIVPSSPPNAITLPFAAFILNPLLRHALRKYSNFILKSSALTQPLVLDHPQIQTSPAASLLTNISRFFQKIHEYIQQPQHHPIPLSQIPFNPKLVTLFNS